MEILGDCWTLLIVRDALFGRRRFTEFQKSLKIAKNTLTTRLRGLVADGILEVKPASDGSAFQEYVPTEKGRGLLPIVLAIRQWGGDHFFDPKACPGLVDAKDGRPLQRLEPKAHDGRTLQPEDLKVVFPP
jgi:DNA-binding HxlR family transcriptional regulator